MALKQVQSNQYSDVDKWTIRIVSGIINKVLGKKAGERILGGLISAGIIGKLGAKLKDLIKAGKAGEITDFLNYVTSAKIEARTEGGKIPKLTELIKSYRDEIGGKPLPKKWEDMTKKEKAGSVAKKVGAAAGIIGAVTLALATANQAVKYGADDLSREDKSMWELFWDTSIPGATVNLVASWFGHGRKKSSESQQDEQLRAAGLNSQGELMLRGAAATALYDAAAKEMKMVDRPKHPQAENEWQKEVERRMKESKKTQKFNDPVWYYKGQADKLIAGTLTWTGVKTNGRGVPLVQFMTFNVDLVLPIINQLLPSKLVNNYECLFAALRGPNTGAYSYSAEDVYVYDITIRSMIAKIKFLQKIIKAAHTHDVESDQLAKNLVIGLTGSISNYNDIITNGPSLISRLNALCEEINTWPLVGTSLSSRWNYLADKCIKDYNGPKAVYGVYNIKTAVKFSSTSPALFTRGSVFTTDLATSISNLETEYNDFKSWAGTLSTTNAMLKVAGDFCKLLGTEPKVFANVDYLNQEHPGALTFEFDKEAQFQIQNAMMAGRRQTLSCPSWDGTTPASYTFATTIFTSTTGAFSNSAVNPYKKANKWYVTNDSGVVRSNANNIEMTQFVYNADVTDNTGNDTVHTILDCSVAILETCTIYYFDDINSGGSVSSFDMYPYFNPAVTQGDVVFSANPLIAARQIDFLPTPVYLQGTQNAETIRGQYIDVDNYATIDGEQLQNYVLVGTYSLTYTYSMEDVELKRKVK